MDILTSLLSTFVTQDELQVSDIDRVGVFLAQWLVLLGEESLALQTVTTYLKWSKKQKNTHIRWFNYTITIQNTKSWYCSMRNYIQRVRITFSFRDPLFL